MDVMRSAGPLRHLGARPAFLRSKALAEGLDAASPSWVWSARAFSRLVALGFLVANVVRFSQREGWFGLVFGLFMFTPVVYLPVGAFLLWILETALHRAEREATAENAVLAAGAFGLVLIGIIGLYNLIGRI